MCAYTDGLERVVPNPKNQFGSPVQEVVEAVNRLFCGYVALDILSSVTTAFKFQLPVSDVSASPVIVTVSNLDTGL
jgi:hypothetical protein